MRADTLPHLKRCCGCCCSPLRSRWLEKKCCGPRCCWWWWLWWWPDRSPCEALKSGWPYRWEGPRAKLAAGGEMARRSRGDSLLWRKLGSSCGGKRPLRPPRTLSRRNPPTPPLVSPSGARRWKPTWFAGWKPRPPPPMLSLNSSLSSVRNASLRWKPSRWKIPPASGRWRSRRLLRTDGEPKTGKKV